MDYSIGNIESEGELVLPITLNIGGKKFTGDYSISSFREETDYCLPDASPYKSWVCDVYLSSQLFEQGDNTLTVTVVPRDEYWASSFWVSSSLSLPLVEVDGVEVNGEYGYAPLYGYSYWGLPQPVPEYPSYRTYVQDFNSHTMTFKLDPTKYGYFECDAETGVCGVKGPWVIAGTGNWSTPIPFIVKPSTRNISINNLMVNPSEFIPSKEETVAITASIEATGFTPSNLKWDVKIKDQSGAIKKEYESGFGSQVSQTWDGKDSSGDIVKQGKYLCEITATCDEGIQVQSSLTVAVVPPPPILLKMEFPEALSLRDDNGEPYKHPEVYYEEGSQEVLHHPVVITTDSLSRKSSGRPIQPGQNIVFKFTGYLDPGEYRFRIRDSEGRLITSSYLLATVEKKGKFEITPLLDQITPEVQMINFLKVEYQIPGVDDENWRSVQDSKGQAPKLIKPLFVTLGAYTAPFDKGKNNKGPTEGLLNIACELGKGATTVEEARDKILNNMCTWLVQKGFIYNGEKSFFEIKERKEWEVKSGIFNYDDFMKPYNAGQTYWQGCCTDVSALYALCCACVGAEMNLRRITGKPVFVKMK